MAADMQNVAQLLQATLDPHQHKQGISPGLNVRFVDTLMLTTSS